MPGAQAELDAALAKFEAASAFDKMALAPGLIGRARDVLADHLAKIERQQTQIDNLRDRIGRLEAAKDGA